MHFVTQVIGKFRQFLPCIAAAAVGIAVTVTAVSLIVQREDSDAERQFGVLAENHFMVLQNGLNEYVSRLEAVRALFDSSVDPVRRNEFEAFTRPLLAKTPPSPRCRGYRKCSIPNALSMSARGRSMAFRIITSRTWFAAAAR